MVLIERMKFEKVSLVFENNEVLSGCDFEFPLNQNCRMVFKSDREKFYFFHAMTQIAGFHKGRFLMNDDNVVNFSFEEFMRYRLRTGFGFATRGLLHNQTLRQNIELPIRYHQIMPESQVSSWIETCVDYFDFKKDLDKRPSEVSPSSQKATLLTRAFVHKPELVFLDAPEMLLSNRLQANLLQLIDDHRKHYNLKHLFFSTDDEELSECLADQNIILEKKRLNLVKKDSIKRKVS